MAKVLLVEDDENLRRVLAHHLAREGHAVAEAGEGGAAVEHLRGSAVDLILTDVRMPGMDGMELLRRARQERPGIPVVVMTAFGTIDDAVNAMREGAADYLTKPVERETLLLAVQKALRVGELTTENRRLKESLKEKRPDASILGTSEAIQEALSSIRRVAPTDATVLIAGESGTGKELAARALHALSSRAHGRFVAINCAAVPRDLLESELFGHEKGAFTGALKAVAGKFQLADGGTLFLDEIGDMDMALQAKILRAVQERVVEPIGSRIPVEVDVRVIAASNKDLAVAVREGSFREDLYWRLNVIPLRMPSLRERAGDVPLLMKHFLAEFGSKEAELSPEATAVLESHGWPGNVRELQNLAQRLAIMHPDRIITPELLPEEILANAEGARAEAPQLRPGSGGLWAMEREAISNALREHGGNQSAAARALEIPRHVLLYRMKKYGILPPR